MLNLISSGTWWADYNVLARLRGQKNFACCVCSTRGSNPCFGSETLCFRVKPSPFKQNQQANTMRSPVLLSLLPSLLLSLAFVAPAEGRLFYQTFGSVVPTADGCTWNVNQDYFVPRHCSSGRYGLFSPCKEDCTISPACRKGHPLHPGYCSPYGPLHYCWRNFVYHYHCGCGPVKPCGGFCRHCGSGPVRSYCGPYQAGCGPQCQVPYAAAASCCFPGDSYCAMGAVEAYPCEMYLPNVESHEYQILGSISLAGDPLLTSLQLAQPPALPAVPSQTSGNALEQLLPMLGIPEGEALPPLPKGFPN